MTAPHNGVAQAQPHSRPGLWSFEFFALCAISVLAFSNIAIFYSFYGYLTEIGIPAQWRGPLMALEPFTAFLVRPFLGRFLTLNNGVRFMFTGLVLATASLLLYPLTTSVAALALVRVLHGAGFVTVVGGLMGVLTAYLSHEKSAQGFGLFSITILLPHAIVPPFVELLLPHLPGHGAVYAVAAPLMLPAMLLLIPLRRKTRALAASMPAAHLERPGWGEALSGLRDPAVALLCCANMCLVGAHSLVFYFMRDFALGLAAANPGLFFTCANAATITVRLVFGGKFNTIDQSGTLAKGFFGLALLLPLFPLAWAPWALLCMAPLYGTGMALTMPLINATMLKVSPPRLRAFNANLLMVAVDAGFFVGPLLGGALVAAGWTHAGLFTLGGGLMALAGFSVLPVARRVRLGAESAQGG